MELSDETKEQVNELVDALRPVAAKLTARVRITPKRMRALQLAAARTMVLDFEGSKVTVVEDDAAPTDISAAIAEAIKDVMDAP